MHHGVELEIPEDVEIPTCSHCGESFYDARTAKLVDDALDEELERRRRLVLERAVNSLERLTTRAKLEALLNLSPGYLSKMLSGKKKVSHRTAMLLDFIAQQPGVGLERAVTVFERAHEGSGQ